MKHRLSRTRITLLLVPPSVVTIGAAVGIYCGAPLAVIVVSMVFILLAWYGFMTLPYEFELTPGGIIFFRSICRTLSIPISDITEIDARRWNKGFVFFRHAHGKIALLKSTPGLRELIDSVVCHNPSTFFRGNVRQAK